MIVKMDKKTFSILKYISEIGECRQDKLVERFGKDIFYSLEFDDLCKKNLIFTSNCVRISTTTVYDVISLTPKGREAIESRNRERRKEFIAIATFVLVLLNFLLQLYRNF